MLGENIEGEPKPSKKVSKMRANRANTDDPWQSTWTRHAPKRSVQENGDNGPGRSHHRQAVEVTTAHGA